MENPEYLYHYTSQKGLLGILGICPKGSKPSLWMTNILYLNDSSEYTHTLDLVKSELNDRMKKPRGMMIWKEGQEPDINGKIYYTYEIIQNFCNDFRHDNRFEFYVFSLSEQKDDLSQWRSYCPQEGGFCVEYDYKKLSSILEIKQGYRIKKCIYDPIEKQDLVKWIMNLIDKSFESDKDLSQKDVCFRTFYKIMDISSYIKHESFYSEREYRIINEVSHHEDTYYREGKSMIIPYIEFVPLDENGKLPIIKIIVGPTPHPELSKMSVQNLLKSNGYDIEVEISKIPYRSW